MGDFLTVESRFLLPSDVAEMLNISSSQVYALIRSKQLKAVKIGGRGVWRVERSAVEAYIEQAYRDTETFLDEHPFGLVGPSSEGSEEDDTA